MIIAQITDTHLAAANAVDPVIWAMEKAPVHHIID